MKKKIFNMIFDINFTSNININSLICTHLQHFLVYHLVKNWKVLIKSDTSKGNELKISIFSPFFFSLSFQIKKQIGLQLHMKLSKKKQSMKQMADKISKISLKWIWFRSKPRIFCLLESINTCTNGCLPKMGEIKWI